jgi:hypothetical protein
MSTQLPPDLVTRMQHLAETRTLGSRPFPTLDRAIRRDRVNRFAGMAAALAVVAAIATGAVVSGPLDRPRATAPASTARKPQTVAAAGYPTTMPAGRLGVAPKWAAGMQRKVFERGGVASPADVHVVVAGQIDKKMRYAVVVYRTTDDRWIRQFWVGHAKAGPGTMRPGISESSADGVPNEPLRMFSVAGDRTGVAGDTADPVVIVSAPGSLSVSILSEHSPNADGTVTERLRGLPSAGVGVWADSVTKGEYRLKDVQVDGQETDG